MHDFVCDLYLFINGVFVCVAQSHCPLLLLSVLSALVSIMPGSSLRLVRLSHAETALPPRIVAYSPRLAIYAALFDFNRPNCRSGSRIDHICSYAVDRCSSRCRAKNKKNHYQWCTNARAEEWNDWRFVCHSLLRATNRNFPSFFCCCVVVFGFGGRVTLFDLSHSLSMR